MKRLVWLLAAPALLGATPPLDAETRKDLRCFLAISSLSTNTNPTIAMSGAIGAQYFLGRVDGRTPTLNLERALVAEATAFTAADIPPLLRSCGKQVQERGETIKAIGDRMQAQAPPTSSS